MYAPIHSVMFTEHHRLNPFHTPISRHVAPPLSVSNPTTTPANHEWNIDNHSETHEYDHPSPSIRIANSLLRCRNPSYSIPSNASQPWGPTSELDISLPGQSCSTQQIPNASLASYWPPGPTLFTEQTLHPSTGLNVAAGTIQQLQIPPATWSPSSPIYGTLQYQPSYASPPPVDDTNIILGPTMTGAAETHHQLPYDSGTQPQNLASESFMAEASAGYSYNARSAQLFPGGPPSRRRRKR